MNGIALRHRVKSSSFLLGLAALTVFVTASPVLAGAALETRFQWTERVSVPATDWVTASAGYVAWGSGEHIGLGQAGPPLAIKRELELGKSVVDAVLVRDQLYLGGADGTLSVVDLGRATLFVRPESLSPDAQGALHLTQMDDYLVVAEDGLGLRILALPHPSHPTNAGAPTHHAGTSGLLPVSAFALDASFEALAVSGRTIYAAVERAGFSRIAVIDAVEPTAPRLVREIPFAAPIADLGTNGAALYVVGPSGLEVLDLALDPPAVVDSFPDVTGKALDIAGRRLWLAGDDGISSLLDLSPTATFIVTVADSSFTPLNLTIVVGDTVNWQKANTVFPHNVKSCTAPQVGCNGQTATETFTSGATVTTPFNFSKTFTLAGSDPYVCESHAKSQFMQGKITVINPPPAVPGLKVEKLTANGSQLRLSWANTCGSTGHHVVFGQQTGLPAIPGNTYTVSGSACGAGASPFTWLTAPAPTSGKFIWFLMLADQGSTIEGSWGHDSAGNERNGTGAGGSSGQCGATAKNVTNQCGT